jgi:hypothetical protein
VRLVSPDMDMYGTIGFALALVLVSTNFNPEKICAYAHYLGEKIIYASPFLGATRSTPKQRQIAAASMGRRSATAA